MAGEKVDSDYSGRPLPAPDDDAQSEGPSVWSLVDRIKILSDGSEVARFGDGDFRYTEPHRRGQSVPREIMLRELPPETAFVYGFR